MDKLHFKMHVNKGIPRSPEEGLKLLAYNVAWPSDELEQVLLKYSFEDVILRGCYSPRERAFLRTYYLDGKTMAQGAQEYGISTGRFRQILYVALHKIERWAAAQTNIGGIS